MPTIWGVYVSWIYMLLDISCQHLGDECKLEGFCVPFGHRVGEITFLRIYICIGYMTPIIVFVTWIYMILDISCQHLGDECKLEGFCVPFGHRIGVCTFWKLYICNGYMLPTIWGYMSVKYTCWYWIYHANTWGMTVSWRVSVCPSDTGLGMYIYENIVFCIGYMLPTIWGVYVSWIYMLI